MKAERVSVPLEAIPEMAIINHGQPREFRFEAKQHSIPHGSSVLPTGVARFACQKYRNVRFARNGEKHVCGDGCKPKDQRLKEGALKQAQAALEAVSKALRA